jgi:hypothetical protein
MNLTFQGKILDKLMEADPLGTHGWPATPMARRLGLPAKMPHNAAMRRRSG